MTDAVDDLFNTKLQEMSIEDRSDGLYDVHGVAENLPKETPEMLQEKLEEMDQALLAATASSSSSSKSNNDSAVDAYRQAIALNQQRQQQQRQDNDDNDDTDYIERLKIPFLRSEGYNSQKAAERMIRFFDKKLELFGTQLLIQDITISPQCFNEEEMKALYAGVFQVLSHRDRVGRGILFMPKKVNVLYSTRAVSKVFFYLVMAAMQDVDTQRNGIVIIYYAHGSQTFVADRPRATVTTALALPWRVTAVHFCGERHQTNTSSSLVFQLVTMGVCSLLENTLLCRFRRHFGTDMECIYTLMTFGIPKDVIPIQDTNNNNNNDDDDDGSLDLTHHLELLEMLKRREDEKKKKKNKSSNKNATTATTGGGGVGGIANNDIDPSLLSVVVATGDASTTMAENNRTPADDSKEKENDTPMVVSDGDGDNEEYSCLVLPGPMDIVLGKGRYPKNSAGYLRMHKLVEEKAEEYEAATKYDKTIIGDIILRKLELHYGCRFLKLTPTGYAICEESIPRAKISHAFRNMRARKKRLQQQQQQRQQQHYGGPQQTHSVVAQQEYQTTTANNNKNGSSSTATTTSRKRQPIR